MSSADVWHLTLRFTCTGERDSRVHATEDRRSPVSGASVCWALVVAQGCAGTSRPPRPTPARRTTPPRLGSPPPRRTRPPGYRGGRDTARHAPHACSRPAVAGGAPAADHPRPGLRATRPACGGPCDARRRGLAQAQAEAPIRARHASDRRPHTRHGDATHAPGCAGPAAPARPGKTGGLPRPWGATLRAVRSPHAMAERRPASGDAPTRGETPSQAEQSLLVLGVCS